MEIKKNKNAEVSRGSTAFFLFGLLVTQLLVLGAFSYTKYEKVDKAPAVKPLVIEEEIEIIENTQQPAYYVPPPPPPSIIEVAETDDLADDDEVELADTEFDSETVISDPVPFSNLPPGGVPGAPPPPIHVDEGKIHEFVEIMPEYPGGINAMISFIEKNFRYPEEARRFDVEGRVLISFLVDEKGKITEVKPLLPENRQLGYGLEAEAVRVVKMMPSWKPGIQGNRPVKVRYTLPIACNLN